MPLSAPTLILLAMKANSALKTVIRAVALVGGLVLAFV